MPTEVDATFEQVMSAAMRAVDQAGEGVDQIESEFPWLSNLGEYELTSDGIDIGRDGSVTPWGKTPWTGSFDFREKTTATVSGIQFPNEEPMEIVARPDERDRGSGWRYVVSETNGNGPEFFNGLLMNSVAELREKMRDFVNERFAFLRNTQDTQDPGGNEDQADSQPETGFEVVEELELGWVLVVKRPEEVYLVLGRRNDSEVFLDEQGEVVQSEFTFPSKERARRAFRRWRDRREGNISEARSELNAALRERAEDFEDLQQQQDEQANVVTESNVVEGETQVVEGDSRTVTSAGSGQRGASSANSGSITLPNVPEIPVAGVAVVVLGVLFLVLGGDDMDTEAGTDVGGST